MSDRVAFRPFAFSSAAFRPGDLVLIAGAVAVVLYACLYAGPYALRLLTVAGAYALAVLGYQLIFGLCGALSLAQGAFFGVGAYVGGLLAMRWGVDFTVAACAAALVPAVVAALVGAAVLRLESHYFALATLGVAQIALLAVVNGPAALGGANGLPGVPGVVLFGVPAPRGLPLAALVWALVAAAALFAWALARGRFGRSLTMVRENPLAAACLGLDVGRLRLAAFTLSAAFAGLGGAVAAHAQRVVSPEALEFPVMVAILTMTVVGGRGRAAGALLGALLLTFLPEWLGGLGQGKMLFYGLALLAAVILLPEGVAGTSFFRPAPSPLPPPVPLPPVPLSSPALPAPAFPAAPRSGGGGLEARGLVKAFGGVRAVDGVNLRVAPGEIVGLIGPNGSGKTTLINLLSGLERADAGETLLNGVPAPALPHRRARAGLARSFQTPALPDGTSALDVVAAAFYADGLSPAAARRAAAPALAAVGLSPVGLNPAGLGGAGLGGAVNEAAVNEAAAAATAAATVDALPMAARRLIDLALALARRPSVLLLDEPAAGLTVAERTLTADLIRDAAAAGVAVLAVDHDMGFLLPLCRRVVCLDRGRVIFDGPAGSVAADPAVRAAYFGGAQ